MAQGNGAPLEVAIAGGGVAALEALLALRDMAGDRVAPTLISRQKDFVYRPLSVGAKTRWPRDLSRCAT